MRAEHLQKLLRQQPFRPFRIYMSDGATFDVRHQDMCLIGRSALYVVIPDARQPWMYDRLAHCALIHITRIEPLNGRNGRRPPSPRRRGG